MLTSSLESAGPGLAIRVLCAEEPYMCKDFAETAVVIKFIVDFGQASKTVSVSLTVFDTERNCLNSLVG